MLYDRDELNALCESVSLLDYASKSFEFVKKDSHNYACHCPRHIDKTPSLMIDEVGNYFYCFSCGVSGDIISWLRIFEGYSFNDAVAKTARLAGTDLNSLKSSDSILLYKKLSCSHEKELIKREILPPTYYDQFSKKIPKEWVDEGISEETLLKYEIRIDERANRIVYPVYDRNYNLIGVKGRTRFENYKTIGIQKYMNYRPIGTTDFFAGMKQAEPYIAKSKRIIIFEGIKSVMKMDSWGYHNCVSSETSHLNDKQIELLIHMGVKEVIIAYDKDVNLKKLKLDMLRRFTNVYGIIDHGLLKDKEAPVDRGRDVWNKLYESRVRL